MDKNVILMVIALAAIGGGAWYQHHTAAAPAPATVAAKGKPGQPPVAGKPPAPAPPAAGTDAAKQLAAEQALRAEIETALHTMKVTSILLGEPAIVIINKEEYSVGSELKLPSRKTLQVKGIDEGGVTLAHGGQIFHLDAPGAPDLAASRKPR